MKDINGDLLNFVLRKDLAKQIFKGGFGLEKENVRVDAKGRLALTPHPRAFGDKLYNPCIKTDFSESQVEVITPVCGSVDEAYSFLENLQDIVSANLEDEYLWPQSNPPILPEERDIPIAVYPAEGLEEREYREKLARKYGRKKQLLSGIHYNFSFDEDFLKILHREFGENTSYKAYKDAVYLKVTKNFLKYRWFLIYLTGASPVFHKTFGEKLAALSNRLDGETYYFEGLSSLRNSRGGYKNDEDFVVSYESLEEYVQSIQTLIDEGKIESASEFYSPIRLKGSSKKTSLEQLRDEGIKYIELRIFDLNPFAKNGIFLEDLYLVHLFLIYLLFTTDEPDDQKGKGMLELTDDLSTVVGTRVGVSVYTESGELVKLQDVALDLVENLKELVNSLGVKVDYLTGIMEAAKQKILKPEGTHAHKVVQEVINSSYIAFHIQKATEYREASRQKVGLTGYEDLELSTQILIKDAIKRGITFEILDREDNFLKLKKDSKVEYVKQATKTSRDSYIAMLIMENKIVTKEVLKEHDLAVPASVSFTEISQAKEAYHRFCNGKIVIKPKSTNFGVGISIFKNGFTREQFERAVEIAFSHDHTVLIEDFVDGKEYRFLVIGEEVVAVLHRMPANVRGDGTKTIRELVKDKNQDPLRGEGHKTPLEKITLGEIEETFLKTQGKDFAYVPGKGETIFLRENSNISTGGDSIDYTENVHQSYKRIALQAAKAVGAAITGVDLIIKDIGIEQKPTNYAIIEMNFNPAMYMHCYPYRGKNRQAGEKVLDLLFG